MGCGGSKLSAAMTAIRTGDNSPEAQELIASLDCTKKTKDGNCPLVEACRCGRTKMVKFMLENDRKGKISRNTELINRALRENCKGKTQADLVELLLNKGGAQPNYQSGYGDSPLTLLAMRNELTSAEVLTQRRLAAVVLIEEGVDFGLPNGEQLTALQVACKHDNERMALLLAEKGADIMDCQRFMRKEDQARNWVAGSVLSRYAFKYPKFVRGLKRQFLQMFDVNGDGELDREELTHFIAAHVKMAFKAGLMPTQEFFDDGTLEIGQIESLLETRCKDMLKGYFAMDKDSDGTYSWEELLPIVKDFYTNLWNQSRPADADQIDDVDYAATNADEALEHKTDGADGDDEDGADAGADGDYGPGLNQVNHEEADKRLMAASSRYMVTDDALPEGWTAVYDPLSASTYYWNQTTRETTWDRPTA